MKRLPLDKTSDMDIERLENAVKAHSISNTICYGSESSAETEFDKCKCNNNTSDCDFVIKTPKITFSCACLKENRQNDGNISVKNDKVSRKLKHLKKRKSSSKNFKKHNENMEMCQALSRNIEENKCCEISSEHNLSAVGGDGEEKRQERSLCWQHELNYSPNEINRPDVTMSCDLTSNPVIKLKSEENFQNKKITKDCPSTRINSCSVFQNTCSEGSYSRRKHHKHHKHKKRNERHSHSEEDTPVSPKVNPIFVWVRQEDTKIVEVMCEDYDHRNRLRLTRTHLGWRAIPKTKTFAEAVVPKATPIEDEKDSFKPKHKKKDKKHKKKKEKKRKFLNDNPNIIKECSVALCRDDLANYEFKDLNSHSPGSPEKDGEGDYSLKEKDLPESENSPEQVQPSSPEPILDSNKLFTNFRKLTKSNSCDFTSYKETLKSFPRSISLDFNINYNNLDFKVQNYEEDVNKSEDSEKPTSDVKSEFYVEKEVNEEKTSEVELLSETELEKNLIQRNHSESVVVDMTKHDLDFNDTDCDELGQLLKDIPDLAFVEEDELEEIDEEEWLKPTDLTVQKSALKSEIPDIKLPAEITPVVTVTSSAKPPEPLSAPLPEVTITPILKPKPAHQQKPQNNLLEDLLSSSRFVKPESNDGIVSQKKQGKQLKLSQCDRKAIKHFQDNDFELEVKNKKPKVEDITLKTLLSKHSSGRTGKSANVESCIQKLKAMDKEECSNSRLKELLTDTISSDPITQLKEVLSNPLLSVPDPLLVPRARLPALVASPASEIPRLLSMHLDKTIEETPCPPLMDSDILEVSLSNLQSLLSCTPEKLNNANTQDLAKYQKSLETLLEWQRYQSELVGTQMKHPKSGYPGFPNDVSDVTAATAFSQMLWLPYLNQCDMNCNGNRDYMSLTNSMLMNDYQANYNKLNAPPQINTNQVSQPSPFLTPTSPMEFESHLKTLAMWQEALIMQQNSQFARACTKVASASNHQDMRRNSKFSNIPHPTVKKFNPEPNLQGPKGPTASPISSRVDSMQNNLDFDIYKDPHMYRNDYLKKPHRQQRSEHHNQSGMQQRYQPDIQNQYRKMRQNYQTELMKQCKMIDKSQLKNVAPTPGSISVKPLSNLVDRSNHSSDSKKFWEHLEDSKNNTNFTDQVASRLLQFNTHIQRTSRKEEKTHSEEPSDSHARRPVDKSSAVDKKPSLTETPKLKVKNLVDPNMSPPKLLKQVAPEHLPMVMDEKGPMQDDGQPNLWHPLFGSNQMKLQPYNSPWRWTTVTVNGE